MKISLLERYFKPKKILKLIYSGDRDNINEKSSHQRESDKVDLASRDSFPASDPPAWCSGGPRIDPWN